MDRQYLTTTEAGAMFGVGPRTIVKWAKDGKIPYRLTLGGHRRFDRAELQALVDSRTSAT